MRMPPFCSAVPKCRIPAGQVDGGCHLEIEIDVGFLCGYECLDDVRYIAFRQIMRLEFIRIQMEPCFRSGYHLIV